MSEVSIGTLRLAEKMVGRGYPASAIARSLHGHIPPDDIQRLAAQRERVRELEARRARQLALFSTWEERRREADRLAKEIAAAQKERDRLDGGVSRYRIIDLTRVSFDSILRSVCEKHDMTKAELIGERRFKAIVEARHEVMFLAAKLTTMSMPQIGARLGGRDHTTVLHGILRHCERHGLPHPRKAGACQ